MSNSITEAYSIFQQPWWLDATAPGQWDEVRIEEGGKAVARMPFVVKDKLGIRVLGQPALTQTLGPWILDYADERTEDRLAREKDLFTKLIDKLPRHDAFRQSFSPRLTNWLPFYWRGFSETTRYTYVIDTSPSLGDLRAHLSKSARKTLNRAERRLEVTVDEPLDTLLRLNKLTFARQNLQVPYPPSLVHRIDEAVVRNGARQLLVARDSQTGEPHVAAYTVGDEARMYALVSGGDPDLRNSGAGYLLKWKSIETAKAQSVPLDLEGSMMENVEHFYRRLGAYQTPYFNISRANTRGSAADKGWRSYKALKRKLAASQNRAPKE